MLLSDNDIKTLIERQALDVATADDLRKEYKLGKGDPHRLGAIGFALFVSAAQTTTADSDSRDDALDYVQDAGVKQFMLSYYDIPENLFDGEEFRFHKCGSTSILLRIRRKYALKIIKPWYFANVRIGQAADQYKSIYSKLGTYAPKIIESKERWIAMDFVDGSTLAEYSIKFIFPLSLRGDQCITRLERACTIVENLCAALTDAAESDLNHLDLTPWNVLIKHSGEGKIDEVRLIDFGRNFLITERVKSPDAARAQVYIADEVKNLPDDGDVTSDVYSLGMILLGMLGQSQLDEWDIGAVLDAAWMNVPDMAEVVEELAAHDPKDRLLGVDRDPRIYAEIKERLITALKLQRLSLLQEKASPSSWQMIGEILQTIVPVVTIVEMSKRYRALAAESQMRRRLSWVLFFGFCIQLLLIGTLILGSSIVLIFPTFALCKSLGHCLVLPAHTRPVPLDGAFGGRINSLLPGRIVAISFAMVLLQYYNAIFRDIAVGSIKLKGMRGLSFFTEFFLRAHPFIGVIPILTALVFDPKLWAACSGIGLLGIVLNNAFAVRFARRAHVRVCTELHINSSMIRNTLNEFRSWWEGVLLYSVWLLLLFFLLKYGLAVDEWLYALSVALGINFWKMYRDNCVRLAPDVHTMLLRLIVELRRVEKKANLSAAGVTT